MPDIFGIIPARANSKRLPGKNMKMLFGKPLVQFAIEAAMESKLLDKIVLSSDSNEILNVAKNFGDAVIPLMRPAELAADESPAIEYVKHALDTMYQNFQANFEIIVIIQPSSPLTRGRDIDNTIELMKDYDADCAVSVREVPFDLHPSKYLHFEGNQLKSLFDKNTNMYSQMNKLYVRNGSVYVSKVKLINEGKILSDNCAAYIMPQDRSVDINNEFDLQFADYLLHKAAK